MSSLNRKAFWDVLQSEMDAVGERPIQEQSGIRKLIRGMPDILISTIQLRPESVAARLLVEHRCFNTVGPLGKSSLFIVIVNDEVSLTNFRYTVCWYVRWK